MLFRSMACLIIALDLVGPAHAEDLTAKAVKLLRASVECPIPPTGLKGDEFSRRVLSILRYTGDSTVLKGSRTDTIAESFRGSETRVRQYLLDISVRFADIKNVNAQSGGTPVKHYVEISCGNDDRCINLGIREGNGPRETEAISTAIEEVCDAEAADNARAAIEFLVRKNGGTLLESANR